MGALFIVGLVSGEIRGFAAIKYELAVRSQVSRRAAKKRQPTVGGPNSVVVQIVIACVCGLVTVR